MSEVMPNNAYGLPQVKQADIVQPCALQQVDGTQSVGVWTVESKQT